MNAATLRREYLPDNWRDRLPDPASYYPSRLEKIGRTLSSGWTPCRCPFHEDKRASASVNLTTGGFRCHGCGAKGDLVAFHERITGHTFRQSVRDLLGLMA